tara:strand:- start:728 stop:1567 length:840 start_codon:yes stop_codon:yes gene_type:complete
MAIYNFIILAALPIVFATFEKDIDEGSILRYPQLYRRTQSWSTFSNSTLSKWWLTAFYHSIILFFGTYFLFYDGVLAEDGQTAGLKTFGNIVLSTGILLVILELAINILTWNVFMHIFIWGTYFFYVAIFALESQFPQAIPSQYKQFERVYGMPVFYTWAMLAAAMCILPELGYKYWRTRYHPKDFEILREQHVAEKGGQEPAWNAFSLYTDSTDRERSKSFVEQDGISLATFSARATQLFSSSPLSSFRQDEEDVASSSSHVRGGGADGEYVLLEEDR